MSLARRRGFKLVELLTALGAIALIAAVLFPVALHRRRIEQRASCQDNLKRLMLGVMQYVQDYDERLPLIAGNGHPGDPGYGWAGAVGPYIQHPYILQCPADNTPPAATSNAPGYSDYWLNPRLQKLNLASLPSAGRTIASGDGHGGTGAYTYAATTSPARDLPAGERHLQGANYAMADGHIAWLWPRDVGNAAPSRALFSFRAR